MAVMAAVYIRCPSRAGYEISDHKEMGFSPSFKHYFLSYLEYYCSDGGIL